jgi:hypothetical protein
MVAHVTRWFLIAAPVVAGIMVLIFGTAGSISTTFGIVLIGIGPIVWMWNWFVRMSFEEERSASEPPAREEPEHKEQPSQHVHPEPAPGHTRKQLTRRPRRRS